MCSAVVLRDWEAQAWRMANFILRTYQDPIQEISERQFWDQVDSIVGERIDEFEWTNGMASLSLELSNIYKCLDRKALDGGAFR